MELQSSTKGGHRSGGRQPDRRLESIAPGKFRPERARVETAWPTPSVTDRRRTPRRRGRQNAEAGDETLKRAMDIRRACDHPGLDRRFGSGSAYRVEFPVGLRASTRRTSFMLGAQARGSLGAQAHGTQTDEPVRLRLERSIGARGYVPPLSRVGGHGDRGRGIHSAASAR